MNSYDIRVKDGDSVAAVTITDLLGEGTARRVREVLADEFDEVTIG